MHSSKNKKTAGNQSAVKTMKILETLAEDGHPMRLLDIAKATDMNTSTTLRFINSLIESGYVHQESDSQKYMLTLRIASLADNATKNSRMKIILRDVLVSLSRECGESVCLAVNEHNEVMYLDVVDGPSRILKATQRIGHRAPLYCTGVGKLMLLNYSADELKRIADMGMEKLTANTITTLSRLKSELADISENMYSMDNEECEYGLKCVAAPIIGNNREVIAALSVTGPASRLNDETIPKIIMLVQKAADNAAGLLGY